MGWCAHRTAEHLSPFSVTVREAQGAGLGAFCRALQPGEDFESQAGLAGTRPGRVGTGEL